jgi:hypothetical protein
VYAPSFGEVFSLHLLTALIFRPLKIPLMAQIHFVNLSNKRVLSNDGDCIADNETRFDHTTNISIRASGQIFFISVSYRSRISNILMNVVDSANYIVRTFLF